MLCEEIISREDARAAGLTRFYTGEPCKRGHLTYRLVSDTKCAQCLRIKSKRLHKGWRDRNKDKIFDYRVKYLAKDGAKERKDFTNKRWQENNPDKCRAYSRKFRDNNPDKSSLSCKKWRDKNPEKLRVQWNSRNSRRVNALGSFSADDIRDLMKLQRRKCAYYRFCNSNLDDDYHVDHIVALVNGGTNFRSNLQLLCPRCNLSKQAKDPIVFSQKLGFLL